MRRQPVWRSVRYKGSILGWPRGPVNCLLDPDLLKQFETLKGLEKKIAGERIYQRAFNVGPEKLPAYFDPGKLIIRQIQVPSTKVSAYGCDVPA